MTAPDDVDSFLLSLTGQIKKAKGIEEGITQTSVLQDSDTKNHIFNFPIDITWRSSNPFGWPQLVIHAYGVDVFGKDVIRGYGAVHVPMNPGLHTRKIALFVPKSSSKLMQLNAWITGVRPEFVNPKVVAQANGREVTQVQTQGFIDVEFGVTTRDMRTLGYVAECVRQRPEDDVRQAVVDDFL